MKLIFFLLLILLIIPVQAENKIRADWEQELESFTEVLDLDYSGFTSYKPYRIAIIDFIDLEGNPFDFGRFLSDELTTRIDTIPEVEMIDRFELFSLVNTYKPEIYPDLNEELINGLIYLQRVELILTGQVIPAGENWLISSKKHYIEYSDGYEPQVVTVQAPDFEMTSFIPSEVMVIESSDLDGTWDFKAEVFRTVDRLGNEESQSATIYLTAQLEAEGNELSGKLQPSPTGSGCDEAEINGAADKLRIEFVTHYTGECCYNSEIIFKGVLRMKPDGSVYMYGYQEPVSQPETDNCLLWWANVKGERQ